MIAQVKLDSLEYIIERIYENEFVEPIKFDHVRFGTIRASNWQPKYLVTLSYQKTRQLNILVDSGVDFCLMPKQLGVDLGYGVGVEEVMSKSVFEKFYLLQAQAVNPPKSPLKRGTLTLSPPF